LIQSAQAQTAAPGGACKSAHDLFCRWCLIFVVFYFLLNSPADQRAKEHRAMVAALEVAPKLHVGASSAGDRVSEGNS